MKKQLLAPGLLASMVACAISLSTLPARADEAGCIAASEQALTLRKDGKLHDALKQLAICAEASCSSEVKAECAQRIDSVDAAMPTLVLGAKDGAGNDLYDVRVSMDGAPLTSRLDGRPLSIDPGEHAFTFEVEAAAPVEKKLVLREGEKDRHESVVIGPPPAPSAPPTAALPPPSLATPPAPPPHAALGTQKTLAIVGGGVGVIGVALGAWFGAFAASSQSQEKSDCSATACKNPRQATEDYNTARTDALVSTVAFVMGGAALAAGAVLWLTAPPDHPRESAARLHVAPAIDGRSGRLVVGGEF